MQMLMLMLMLMLHLIDWLTAKSIRDSYLGFHAQNGAVITKEERKRRGKVRIEEEEKKGKGVCDDSCIMLVPSGIS